MAWIAHRAKPARFPVFQTYAGTEADAVAIYSQIQRHPTDLAILAALPDQDENLSPAFLVFALSGLISPMADVVFDWTKGAWSAIGAWLWRSRGQPQAPEPAG